MNRILISTFLGELEALSHGSILQLEEHKLGLKKSLPYEDSAAHKELAHFRIGHIQSVVG